MECLPKLCEVCDEGDKIYKCPRCGLGTCSLKCCIDHKRATGCDGKRDKTAFVKVKEFGEALLKSDYHFLEDVLQTRQSAKRTFEIDCGGEQKGNVQNNKRQRITQHGGNRSVVLPVQPLKLYNNTAKAFVKQAKDRDTTVLLQPQGMSKRKENTSRFDKKRKCIIWQLTVAFVINPHCLMSELLSYDAELKKPSGTNCNVVGLYVKDVSETITIRELISQVLLNIPSGSILSHLLRPYKSANIADLHVLIRKMPSPANDPLFAKMSVCETLRTELSGHQIIEFPTLYICQSSALSQFRLLIASSNIVEEPKLVPQLMKVAEDKANNLDRGDDIYQNSELVEGFTECEESALPLEVSLMQFLPECVGGDDEKIEEDENDYISAEEDFQESGIDTKKATEEEDDEEYDDFMRNLMDLQGKDIKTLHDIIRSTENEEA